MRAIFGKIGMFSFAVSGVLSFFLTKALLTSESSLWNLVFLINILVYLFSIITIFTNMVFNFLGSALAKTVSSLFFLRWLIFVYFAMFVATCSGKPFTAIDILLLSIITCLWLVIAIYDHFSQKK